MKHKKKPYYQRKVYRRKTGGANSVYWLSGRQKGSAGVGFQSVKNETEESSIGIAKQILKSIGFRIRGDK